MMIQGIKQFNYPVKDLAKAKTLYTKVIGVEPYADSEYYVGFRVGDQEIGLDPNGHNLGMTGPVGFYHVDDIKATLESFAEAGAQVQQEPKDVGGGKLVAYMKDADGNSFGLIQEPS